MFLNKTRAYHKRAAWFAGLLTDNPVLSLGLALPFVVSASYSLQAAVCVLAGMVAVTLPMMLLASLVRTHLPAGVRVPLYALCSVALLIPVERQLAQVFPAVLNSLGVYFPIIAVNTLMMYFCEKRAVRESVPRALWTALLQLMGFGVVIALVACVRELFGGGTLWGVPVAGVTFRLGGLLIPFGGCITVAFIAAASKYLGRLLRGALYRSDHRTLQRRRRMMLSQEPDGLREDD